MYPRSIGGPIIERFYNLTLLSLMFILLRKSREKAKRKGIKKGKIGEKETTHKRKEKRKAKQ